MAGSEAETGGIGIRLRAARTRLGWSREELAVQSGLSWSAIAQVESGRRTNLRPHTLSALADALGVTIDYLLHGAPSSSAMLEHRVLLYETEQEFVETVGPYLSEGLERSEAVLAVTTSDNIELLRELLGSGAEQVEFVDRDGWYVDPAPALRSLEQFVRTKLREGAPWVRMVGDPDWTAKPGAEAGLWARYESLVNLVFADLAATLLCAYDTRSVAPEVVRQAVHTHPQTVGQAGIAISPAYSDPAGFLLKP